MLTIFYTSCDRLNIATCKTESEVTEWLKHKYVLLYYTEDRYVEGQDNSLHYSTFQQIPVNRIINMNHRFQLKST